MGPLSINKYENVFDDDFCHELFNDCISNISDPTKYNWKSNYSWSSDVFKGSFPVQCRLMDEKYTEKILNNLFEKNIIDNKNYSVNNFVWTRLSYIPWHNDGIYEGGAVTIYLNPIWDENWGGIFMYREENSDEIHGIMPKFNTAVKVNNYTLHSVSFISPLASCPRYTLQLFPIKTTTT